MVSFHNLIQMKCPFDNRSNMAGFHRLAQEIQVFGAFLVHFLVDRYEFPTWIDFQKIEIISLSALSLGCFLIMPLCLGPVAAGFHTAPAPAVVAAGVDEQVPAAAIVRTFSHPFNFF